MSGKIIISKDGWQCKRCGYKWIPRLKSQYPHTCPECKSVRWDQERKN